MTHISYLARIILILIFLISHAEVIAQNQCDTSFADYLYRHGDYFRAISVWKCNLYFSKDTVEQQKLYSKIGISYLKSKHYDLSIENLTSARNLTVDKETYQTLGMYRAMNYLSLGLPVMADIEFQDIKSPTKFSLLVQSLLQLEKRNGDSAKVLLEQSIAISQNSKNLLEHEAAVRQMQQIREFQKIPKKSPIIAGVLSLIVPGLGQAYSGHLADGIQAFSFVGLFGLSAYAALQYDKSNNHGYATSIITGTAFTLFHVSNIIGAVRTAEYNNDKQLIDISNSFRISILATIP